MSRASSSLTGSANDRAVPCGEVTARAFEYNIWKRKAYGSAQVFIDGCTRG